MKNATKDATAVKVKQSPNRCPFCHDDVQAEESVACRDCLARHHEGCWNEGVGCSACRCQVRMSVAGDREAITPRVVTRALVEKGYSQGEIRDWLANRHETAEREPLTKKAIVGLLSLPWISGILGALISGLLAEIFGAARDDVQGIALAFGIVGFIFGLLTLTGLLIRHMFFSRPST